MLSFGSIALSIALAPVILSEPKIEPPTQPPSAYGPLVVEIVIKCPSTGEGIISYSRLDSKYCTPDQSCYSQLYQAKNKTCK